MYALLSFAGWLYLKVLLERCLQGGAPGDVGAGTIGTFLQLERL